MAGTFSLGLFAAALAGIGFAIGGLCSAVWGSTDAISANDDLPRGGVSGVPRGE
jgi:hypothetical protein